jgi:hypothetical protein
VRASIKPWEERSEIERRRERRETERNFLDMGMSPQEAREWAIKAEDWADSLVKQTAPARSPIGGAP